MEEGNIGKISKRTKEQQPIFREQGNKNLQIRGRKHCKQIRGTNEGNVREHGNKGQFWKGTKEQGPLWETCNRAAHVARTSFLVFIDRTAASEKQTKS